MEMLARSACVSCIETAELPFLLEPGPKPVFEDDDRVWDGVRDRSLEPAGGADSVARDGVPIVGVGVEVEGIGSVDGSDGSLGLSAMVNDGGV